jgi:hypothetical protein
VKIAADRIRDGARRALMKAHKIGEGPAVAPQSLFHKSGIAARECVGDAFHANETPQHPQR